MFTKLTTCLSGTLMTVKQGTGNARKVIRTLLARGNDVITVTGNISNKE